MKDTVNFKKLVFGSRQAKISSLISVMDENLGLGLDQD
jgi:hypothetical protein